jgi:multimeric flavodoxin WrbA
MKKRVLAVLCSPRKDGNSATLARRALEGVTASGGRCEALWINDLSIRPCQACEACQQQPENRCVQQDDMDTVYDALEAADALLIAAPIYMFTVPAQLKLFMDRCFAVQHTFRGKAIGIIFTYGGEDENDSGAVNAIGAMRDAYAYAKAKIVGIVQASANEPGEVKDNTRAMDEAFALGKKLAG